MYRFFATTDALSKTETGAMTRQARALRSRSNNHNLLKFLVELRSTELPISSVRRRPTNSLRFNDF